MQRLDLRECWIGEGFASGMVWVCELSIAMDCHGLTHSGPAKKLPWRMLICLAFGCIQNQAGSFGVNSLTREANLAAPETGKLSFRLASTMDSVAEVEQTVEKVATEAGLDEDETFRVTMASREAAVNAVLHGNAYDPNKQITVSIENTGKSLIIRIADEGEGLDPDKLPDPLAPENLLRGTGRGIFLIRSFLDEVHFRQLHPGTELTLVKHLPPAAETNS
jgi:serine/threonine-protein kinase RsbW